MSEKFSRFRIAANKAKSVKPYTGTVLALDPGETTGYSCFYSGETDVMLHRANQVKTWPMEQCVESLTALLIASKPTIVVAEVYAVYEWKTDSHSWSQVPTLHVIGCLETLCIQMKIPLIFQTAQIAKNFCTDQMLKSWDLYVEGKKHARDSIRHGTYFLLFGASKDS